MNAEAARQDAIANNLANIQTPGYKADLTVQRDFAEVLWANRSTGQIVGAESFGAIARNVTQLSQGAIRQTKEPLNVAILGDGFFRVRLNGGGIGYTRNGQFNVGAGGFLTDTAGHQVLSAAGQPIFVGGNSSGFQVSQDGAISVGGRPAGNLGIVALNNPVKAGDNLWTGAPAAAPAQTVLRQGALEDSNVDPTATVVNMIASNRNFEADQKVLRTIDETLQRGAGMGTGA